MNRYLLFNAGCGTCSTIGDRVQEEAGDVLSIRSLSELEIQVILNKALPDWKWEPMILEVPDDQENIRVYTGVLMRLRLIQLLGITSAWQVASLVYQSIRPLYSFQDRRLFLKYTGSTLAGLAVLGLNPLKSATDYVFETPNTNGRVRELDGQEREAALSEANAYGKFGKFSEYLGDLDYAKTENKAVAYRVEADGYPSVLLVTVPFYDEKTGVTAHAKYSSHSSAKDSAMGIVRSEDGDNKVDVHEVVSDVVKHTKTLKLKDGKIIEEPVGTTHSLSNGVQDTPMPNHSEECHTCLSVCEKIFGVGCGISGYLACNLICLTIAHALCPLICAALYAAICIWLTDKTCDEICGPHPWFGYCP